jgi:hypothetical protein
LAKPPTQTITPAASQTIKLCQASVCGLGGFVDN